MEGPKGPGPQPFAALGSLPVPVHLGRLRVSPAVQPREPRHTTAARPAAGEELSRGALIEQQKLLADMSGTKESIKQAKEWLLQRPDKAETFAKALQKHVTQQPGFQKLLFAVYLLNDIFFAARTKEDPFRRSFAPVLSDIIRGAAKAADNDASRDKLVKVIELWGAKKVFNSEQIEELKVAAKNEPVPVATVQDQRCDLSTIPVGVMAGLVKVALNGGHEPWRPLDLTTMPTAAPMPVEPGRLEARVKEFYRLLEKDKLRRAAQQKPPSTHNDEEEDPEHRAQQDDRKRRRAYEQLDSGYSTRRVDEDATRRQGLDAAIGADNMGHQMLQQMGWREGGLGARGTGIAEPIDVRQQQSNQGVGAQQAQQQQPQDEFSQYRTQRSSQYRSRWGT